MNNQETNSQPLTLEDIIGNGKAFEPPFKADMCGMYIFDKNDQMVLEVRGYGHLQYLFDSVVLEGQIYPMIANHIVELLNAAWVKAKQKAN